MKLHYWIGIVGLAILLVFFLVPRHSEKHTLLRVVTWSDYFPDSILKEFTAKTGIQLELSFISSNEELAAKMKAGATGFDVIQPSDYMVRQMSQAGMLRALDHAQLPHLSHIDSFYRNLPYDPELKHSVPFSWGTTGIVVNTDKVAIPPEGVSWDLLFAPPDPKHTSLLDDMREVFAAALLWKKLPVNSTDPKSLETAKQDIAHIKNKILTFTSEPKPLLQRDEIYIAHMFSTDGAQASADNAKFRYFIPKEGAILWTDNFAIPTSSHQVDEAYRFIDFFLEPEHALELALNNHVATTNKTARARLPKSATDNPNFYPQKELLDRLQMMDDLGSELSKLNQMWTELKSY